MKTKKRWRTAYAAWEEWLNNLSKTDVCKVEKRILFVDFSFLSILSIFYNIFSAVNFRLWRWNNTNKKIHTQTQIFMQSSINKNDYKLKLWQNIPIFVPEKMAKNFCF